LRYPSTGPDGGRWTIAFNGEVYNYRALRARLSRECGAVFATNGDAEVVAAAYHHWGPAALDRLRGMFAFVLWDAANATVHAVRDPFGIKPLHYLHAADGLWLASEKRPLLEFTDRTALDADALSLCLAMQYPPDPTTLHRAVRRLPAGSRLTCRPGGVPRLRHHQRPAFRPAPAADPVRLAAELRDALRDSVRAHMRADVPVGAFLSGGIDSTAIVALAREVNPDLRAFTVGFDRPGYSEIDDAAATAGHLGVRLAATVVRPEDVVAALPRIVWYLDEPVADPSAVPLYF